MQPWNFQLLLFSSNDDPLLPEVKPEITQEKSPPHGLTYLARMPQGKVQPTTEERQRSLSQSCFLNEITAPYA
jgi:hypothetical protein